jgi:pyrophosphatase PpaX
MKKDCAVLFDLDGTLIDSNEIIIESYRSVLIKYIPEETFSRDQIIQFIGPTLSQVFLKYREPEVVEQMIADYRVHYKANEDKTIALYPGVVEGLKALKELGAKLSVVTSKYKDGAWYSFTKFGLEPYFDAFVALDDVKHPKPNKEPVEIALNRLGGADWAIMIGDNPGDIEAGQNAGILSGGVAWSIKGAPFLAQSNPDHLFNTMDEIVQLVKSQMGA